MINRCFQRQVWHLTVLPIKGRLHRKVSTKPDTDIKARNPVWEMIYMRVFGAVGTFGVRGQTQIWGIGDKRTVSRSMEVINA